MLLRSNRFKTQKMHPVNKKNITSSFLMKNIAYFIMKVVVGIHQKKKFVLIAYIMQAL